jgi:hydrogenase-4 component B
MSELSVALGGAALFLLSGALATTSSSRWTAACTVAGGLLVATAGVAVLFGAEPAELVLRAAAPDAAVHLVLDPLAAMFLVPVGVLGALGAVYATRYWSDGDHPDDHRLVRAAYGTLLAGTTLVVLAFSGVLFLFAWEVMALSAFLLIATEHHRAEVRTSAYVFLVATHLSTLLLWVVFARVAAATGTFGFAPLPAGGATLVTLLIALVAFGLKAGFMPLHVWLPGAHASAPTHVSALLSGVVIKVGIYGIIRTTSLAPPLPVGFGGLVLLVGALSAVGGVAFALGQHDLKRLLAYHSVENIGIILLGVGLALLGSRLDRPEWVVLGLAGALLHVWNHAFFKGLLFLAAGAVIHTTGTRDIDRLGGLAGRMPFTAGSFLVGAVAICGLPPLNGFVSELLVYLGLVRSGLPDGMMFAAFATPVLAGVGALAVACFVKVFGVVFLGAPRSAEADRAHEVGAAMRWPLGLLATMCALIGLAPRLLAPALDRAVTGFANAVDVSRSDLPPLASIAPLGEISAVGVGCVLLLGALALALRTSLRTRAATDTWACGYAAPTARMQYTASSFADEIVNLLSGLLRPHVHRPEIEGVFPRRSRLSVHVEDTVLEGAVRPGLSRAAELMTGVRVLQGGRVQLYILYLLLGAVVLLAASLPLLSAFRSLWQ